MVYGIVAVIIFTGIILYLDYRICKLERKVADYKVFIDLFLTDFLKRHKNKSIKLEKDAIDELFK